jgi:NAD(P)-dependent dehydrogenase (short-subunit alcohol dehydrogenase family)
MTNEKYRRNAQFVKCDVRDGDQQVALCEAAATNSPHKSCDIVIANAGIVGADDVYSLQGSFMAR